MGTMRKQAREVVAPKTARRRQGTAVGEHAAESATAPSRDMIERRAYELYVASGCQEGHSEEHWLTAEAQLRASSTSPSS